MALNWLGEKVTEKLRAAQIAGVNQTMGAAVIRAKRSHAWRNRTGTLEGSIDVARFAKPDRDGVAGAWGSQDVRYALIHELGGTIRPVRARALVWRDHAGGFHQAQQVTIPARPYLRPAADAEYPGLAARIKRAYEAGART